LFNQQIKKVLVKTALGQMNCLPTLDNKQLLELLFAVEVASCKHALDTHDPF